MANASPLSKFFQAHVAVELRRLTEIVAEHTCMTSLAAGRKFATSILGNLIAQIDRFQRKSSASISWRLSSLLNPWRDKPACLAALAMTPLCFLSTVVR